MTNIKNNQTVKQMSKKQIVYTSRVRVKNQFVSSGLETTWGGPLRHWEYPEPTPDATTPPTQVKTRKFKITKKSKFETSSSVSEIVSASRPHRPHFGVKYTRILDGN